MKMMCHGVRNLRIQIEKVKVHGTTRFGIWGSIVIIKLSIRASVLFHDNVYFE